MVDVVSKVIRAKVTESKVELGGVGKEIFQKGLGQWTNGALGDRNAGTPSGSDPLGVGRLPTAEELVRASGVGNLTQDAVTAIKGSSVAGRMTQDVLNKFEQGRTQVPNVVDTLLGAPGKLADAFLPTKAGLSRIGLGGLFSGDKPAAVQQQQEPERRLTDPRPGNHGPAAADEGATTTRVRARAEPDAAPPAGPAEPSIADRIGAWWKGKTAAVATAAALVVTPVAAAGNNGVYTEQGPDGKPVVVNTNVIEAIATNQRPNVLTEAAPPAAATAPLKPAEIDQPAVTTAVAPATQFAAAAAPAAAAPAKPSPTFGIDATIVEATQNGASADRLETLRKAREQISKIDAPKPGGMG